MLVLPRQPGQSIIILKPAHPCLITLLSFSQQDQTASVQIVRTSRLGTLLGQLRAQVMHLTAHEMPAQATATIDLDTHVTLVDCQPTLARLGIAAPATDAVHRYEVYEDILNRGEDPAQ